MRDHSIFKSSEHTLICIALAGLVFFSRAWLIRTWGSPLPFWDQWDAELVGLYLPWSTGVLRWQDLFHAHNEHHILMTRLADLVLFVAYGGWNPWAQMLLNAGLHAATAVILAWLFLPALARLHRALFVLGVTALFTGTAGWQNALYGFQSQVYFGNVFATVAVLGLCSGIPFRCRWWLGFAAAITAVFCNAGGILAAGAVLVAGQISSVGKPRSWPTWTAMGLIAVAMMLVLLLTSAAPHHDPLHARNIVQFLAVFTRCLAWPWVNHWPAFLVMQLPLLCLLFIRWRARESLDSPERCALAFGLFAVLQAAAIAYTRGAGLSEFRPLSRYQDPLLLGVAGQLFALLRISSLGLSGRLLALIWTGVALAGLITLSETNFTLHLPFKRAQDRANLAIVRDYAATGDPAVFSANPYFSGPHPDPRVVQRAIDDPTQRALLPAAVLATRENSCTNLPRPIRYGPLLTAISGIFLMGLLTWSLRKRSDRPRAPVTAPRCRC